MAKTNNGDSYENLANAIVICVVEDYRKTLKKYSRNPESKSVKAEVDSLERFFRSQRYSVLTSVAGEFLIRKLRAEINAAIGSMEVAEERLLLKYRYLKNESWEDIACELNVSYRTVHHIHASALSSFIVPE